MNFKLIIGAVSFCLAITSFNAVASIITYSFENSNFSGFYKFDRGTAVIDSGGTSNGGYTRVDANVNEIIDYMFTVSFPQFNFTQSYTPENSSVSQVVNQIDGTTGNSLMYLNISDSSYSRAFELPILTSDITHPYDPGSNPFLPLPPAVDYFFSDVVSLGTVVFNTGTFFSVNDVYSNEYLDSRLVTVTVSTVPVPATLWLFCSGFIGLIGLARRKRA